MSNSRGTLLVRSYLCTRYYFLIIIVLLGSNVILFNIPGMRPAICRGSKSRSLRTHIWWRILGCFLSDMEALLSKYLRSSMHVRWLDDKFSWTKKTPYSGYCIRIQFIDVVVTLLKKRLAQFKYWWKGRGQPFIGLKHTEMK